MVVSDGTRAYPLDSYRKVAKTELGAVEEDVVLGLRSDGFGYIDGGPENYKQLLITYNIPDDANVKKKGSDEARVQKAVVAEVVELNPADTILPEALEYGGSRR